MVLAVGARVKDFTIDKFLGKGSYGAVYKCTRAGDGLPYAMKQINTRNMSHKERQDAVNEIRILASVVNPYVIRFCEAFTPCVCETLTSAGRRKLGRSPDQVLYM